MTWFTRRSMIRLAGVSASLGVLRPYRGFAADKAVTIGIDLSLTGADAETAVLIRDGFMLAIDEANAKGGAAQPARPPPDSTIPRKGRPTCAKWSPTIRSSPR